MEKNKAVEHIKELLTSGGYGSIARYMTGRMPIEVKYNGQKFTVLGLTVIYTIWANPIVQYKYQLYGPFGNIIPLRLQKHTVDIGGDVSENVIVPGNVRRALDVAASIRDKSRRQAKIDSLLHTQRVK